MQQTGAIRLSGGGRRLTVEIEGPIGQPEWWSGTEESRTATYENFRTQLDRLGQSRPRRIDVHIRSTGGNINDALLIYETLCRLAADGAEITTRCSGYTASAATVVAQAASPGRRFVSSNALYLIHNATTVLEGNSLEASHVVRLLGETDIRLAEIYASRSGRPASGFRALMARNGGRGEWLSAEDAVAAGLADRVSRVSPLAEVRDRMIEGVRGWFRNFSSPALSTPVPQADGAATETVPTALSALSSVPSPASFPAPSPVPAAGELRSRVRPSTTAPHEDPTVLVAGLLGAGLSGLSDSGSRNELAYEADALRLRTGF